MSFSLALPSRRAAYGFALLATTLLALGFAGAQASPAASAPTAPTPVGTDSTFLTSPTLAATVAPVPGSYAPGEDVPVSGRLFELGNRPSLLVSRASQVNVPGTFSLRAVWPDGSVHGPYGSFTANAGGKPGAIRATLPGVATAGLTADASTNFEATVAIEVVNASYDDPSTGAWAATRAGAGPVSLTAAPTGLVLENSFVSAVGWVKPGASYPFRLIVRNYDATPQAGVQVTVPAPDGTTFTTATATTGSGTCVVSAGAISWNIGLVAGASGGPTTKTCVVLAQAKPSAQDPEIVWKNLSSTATMTYIGGPGGGVTSVSHGPKVIPLNATYDTARYGDRPFPVVPVDWFERKHLATHTGQGLSDKINSPSIPGSTFNLYQEMSYGQLFPNGTVPSSAIATAGFTAAQSRFTSLQPQGTCSGNTNKELRGTPLYPERIVNGWYQMPGDTHYYGADRFGSGLVGAVAGVGAIFAIDDACGPTGKAVFDAAHIADPEIDYSDYDTDKDGVVDFFMMVYVGAGGHGASQTTVPPYDNIWPHSSSLEFYYTDPATGLKGYISDDQLRDLEERPLFYTNAARTTMTTNNTGIPVLVRVGPYNVNPETSIDNASVISHEYGHSLGLPDFYSTGTRATYGDWNLMATDKSQHMDVFGKQEMGWLVPRTLPAGETTVTGWQDSKVNTHRIDWKRTNGTPYTLTGASVNNGQGYVLKLPPRQILDPGKFDGTGTRPGVGATPDHVWWSRSGNDFGCTPAKGNNLDVYLPQLETLPAGTQVTVTFKSLWEIEWDYDYGYVMISTDGGQTYQSLPSERSYTTPAALNPNGNGCQTQYGNGLTGSSGSYENNSQFQDRALGTYPDPGFLADEYRFNSVRRPTVLRFSYATDPGLAKAGWFIDDLKVAAGANVLYETDFEDEGGPDDPRMFSGGCKDQTRTAATCTAGWEFVSASAGSPADHAYYLEMRDRSGFDVDGKGENDRAAIAFSPGLLLVYTNEGHCYGNAGCDSPPGQSPLDSVPQPGVNTPNLNDAAFTEVTGDTRFSDKYTINTTDRGHTDNYTDPSNAADKDPNTQDDVVDPRYPSVPNPWRFRFNCLTFDVLGMSGKGTAPAFDLLGDVKFTIGSGCVGASSPTSVALRSLSAVAQKGTRTVVVAWRTGAETSVAGYRVFRQTGKRLVRVNRVLVPAKATARGGSYLVRDRLPVGAKSVRYRIEAVGLDGARQVLGTSRAVRR